MSYLDLLDSDGVEPKRIHKLTIEAMEEKIRHLKAQRSAACGQVTGKINELKVLLQNPANKQKVQEVMDNWEKAYLNLKEAHNRYINNLSDEEEIAQAEMWADRKYEGLDQFREEVRKCFSASDDKENQIEPHDSASQVSGRSKRSTSILSRQSSIGSSLIRAKMEAAVRRAELKSRSETLKQKQALEEQSLLIKKQKEQLELHAEVAAEDAKLAAIEEIEKGLANQGDSEDVGVPAPKQKPLQIMCENKQITTEIQKPSKLNPDAASFVIAENTTHEEPVKKGKARDKETINSEDADCYYSIAKQQANLTQLLMEQQLKATLPQRTIPVFTDNPLDYSAFIRAFEYGIEEKTSCAKDRLYYLEQYTAGEANSLVRSCIHMDPEIGFPKAKKLLMKHFGSRFKISESFIQRARNWQEIKAEDRKSLSSFAVFLRECGNTMKDFDYMQEMNHASNIQLLVSKLPYKLRDKWRTLTDCIQEEQGMMVTFDDLVKFVEKQARILSNPVYGDVQGSVRKQDEKDSRRKDETKQRGKRASFAISIDSPSSPDVVTSQPEKSFCVYCSDTRHSLAKCKAFQGKEIEDRIKYLKNQGICFGCLKKAAHIAKDCRKKLKCDVCQRQHPTVLHRPEWNTKKRENEEKVEMNSDEKAVQEVSEETVRKSCGFTDSLEGDCAQTVVPVIVSADGEFSVKTYAFLDNGSNAVFCSKQLMKQLQVKGKKTKLQIQTLNNETVSESAVLCGLSITDLNGNNRLELPRVYMQDTIPVAKEDVPTQKDISQWNYLKPVQISNIDAEVGLLIGRNVPKASEPCQVINSRGEGPYACKTRFGWAVYGLMKKGEASHKATVHRIIAAEHDIEQKIKRLFNHDFEERIGQERADEGSVEDYKFMKIMNETCRLVDGKFEVGLPLRDPSLEMPNNKSQAEQRLMQLKKRFKRDPLLLEEYSIFMNTVFSNGYAEKVPEDCLPREDGRVWYVPHHGVRHPKKKKLRVVYDCAAEYRGRALNKELLQGPVLTSTLVGVLTRFRTHKVAVMADIEAMFSQVQIPEENRDWLRFLWWRNGSLDDQPEEYRMTRHVFGATSSPSCASYALRKTATFAGPNRDVAEAVEHSFYVDDCLQSLPSAESAIRFVKDMVKVCSQGGFNLTKWMSNSKAVLQTVEKTERAKEVNNIDLDKESLPTERALGMLWCAETDKFKYKIDLKEKPFTRRGMLSIVSSIYDPLGLAAAAILPAKIVFQEICRQRLEWDQEIPEKDLLPWKRWLSEVSKLEEFQVDRCLKPLTFGEPCSVQLHHFSDASEKGYGSASYIRLENKGGDVHCSLLMGKARVAPLKQVSIPRLELTAATVATKVNTMLLKELAIPVNETYFWTDSMTVLRYINNESTRFQTFVANRLAVIRDASKSTQWNYIKSEVNPADDCSRGLSIEKFLETKRWLCGPEFLSRPKSEWPTQENHFFEGAVDDLEIKKATSAAAKVNVKGEDGVLDALFKRYSSWHSLKKAVAWILKVKSRLKELVSKKKGLNKLEQESKDDADLTVEDMRNAEKAIVIYLQQQKFASEIHTLNLSQPIKGKASLIRKLDPFVDEEGVLRVGGRLDRADMDFSFKHPMIIPGGTVAKLLVQDVHKTTGHQGKGAMLELLRKKFWIIGVTKLIKGIVLKCVTCRKYNAKPGEQKMASLPVERVTGNEPPFTNVGMDYFGPFEVKRGRSMMKRYGVIFTCLASRAVHLEVSQTLDTDSCINAIRRFVARRGPVKKMWSDNGTNLVGASREIQEEINKWNKSRMQETLLRQEIEWKFNPPAGSHFGGVWERLIRSVRKILYGILKERPQRLDDESLQTLFCEVEVVMNARPITTVTNSQNELEALTPNHLLLMKPATQPYGISEKQDNYSRKRWRQVQFLADTFWRRWTSEYLPTLQMRQKWLIKGRNISKGDIVLVLDTKIRSSYPLAKVVDIQPDKKGVVRVAVVKTATTTLTRPIDKLCVIVESDDFWI
jgi:hypothetical protein